MIRSFRLLWLLFLMVFLASCNDKDAKGKAEGSPFSETGGAHVPLDAATLNPIIQPVGPVGAVPQRISVQFAVPAWDEMGDIPGEDPKTVLDVEPELDGYTGFTGTSTLTFTPSRGFEPGTTYKIALRKLETRDGTIEAPADGWTREFTTPPFKLLTLNAVDFNATQSRATLELVFSAPVEPQSLASHAKWTVDGTAVTDVRYQGRVRPNVVEAILGGAKVAEGTRITVSLDDSLRSATEGRHSAPTDRLEARLVAAKPVKVAAVKLKEGPSGFYFDVICNDAAAQGETHYYEDRDNWDWYDVSSRCLVSDDEARASIHVSPEVPIQVTPFRGGFRVMGDFRRGGVSLTLDTGMRSVDGGRLATAWSETFAVPARSATVAFASKGRYLPRSSWKNLPIRYLNVPSATLEVRQIRPENMIFWMSGSSEEASPRVADLVYKTEVQLLNQPDQESTTWLDLSTVIPEQKQGVFELTVKGGGARDSVRILLTDMNIVVKRSAVKPEEKWSRDVRVWALDNQNNDGIAGVEMKLVRPSGSALATCTTGGDGGCMIEVPVDTIDPTPPFAVIASRGADITYLKFDELKTPVLGTPVEGEAFLSERPYRVSAFTERGVYRPGDTAHFTAIVRDNESKAPPIDMPVKLELMDPRGTVVRSTLVKTNAAGMVGHDYRFEAYARTGKYRVRLSTGDKEIGQQSFSVEEFVPERMKVEVKGPEKGVLNADDAVATVSAQYLFGGSATGSEVELSCELQPSTFSPAQNKQYTYSTWSPDFESPRSVLLGTATGNLGEDGTVGLHCPSMGERAPFSGSGEIVLDAAVFEAGSGRTSKGSARVPLHPERYYIGLQSGATRARKGQAFKVQGIVVDWNGEPVNTVSQLELQVLSQEGEYTWWWDPDAGDERFIRYLRPTLEETRQVQVQGGRFELSVTPKDESDGYLVRVSGGNARTELRLDGSSYYWWSPDESRVDQTPRPMRPTSLDVQLPESVQVDKTAKATFTAPYDGRALVTVETWEIVESEWIDVKAGEQTWKFQVDDFAPNVYVSVFIVKDPYLDSKEAFLPDRAFGVASTRVEPQAFTQAVAISTPKEIRSNADLQVDLDLGPVPAGTFAVVAAVDEGILSLTKYKTPNPLADIFTRRALGVDTFETVGWTFLIPPAGPSSPTGGDEGGGAGRVQPVKPVALFSGLHEVPVNGKLSVTFPVPQYRGALRVMAVVATPQRMGSAETTVLVRDPIVLQTTLPRFLTEADVAQVPVFLTNMSGAAQTVQLSLEAEPLATPGMAQPVGPQPSPVSFLGAKSASVPLANGASATAVFQVRVDAPVGAVKLRVVAQAGSLRSFEELDVPILPDGPTVRRVRKVGITEAQTDLSAYLLGWAPTSEQTSFWVTTNPYGEAFDHLSYLVQYPHGCIEQTTSTVRPLLYVSNLLGDVDPKLLASHSVEDRVWAGIDRILSMQTPEGGFAYWPGATETNFWGTAYATHFLMDAQKAGYAVPQNRLDDAVSYIDGALANRAGHDDTAHGYAFAYGEPYLHYVLASAGKGRPALIQRVLEDLPKNPTGAAVEKRYLLQAALYLTGDHRYAADLKKLDVSPIQRERHNDWSYWSDLRSRAFELNIFQDLFGRDPAGEESVRLVADGLTKDNRSAWYTTQELVWGVTALGRWVGDVATSHQSPQLLVNGKAVAQDKGVGEKAQKGDETWLVARASEADSLSLQLQAPPEGRLYLLMSSQGVRPDAPWSFGGKGVAVTRDFVNLAGEPIDLAGGNHGLGDMVYVRVRVTNQRAADIPNLALVDHLPAGWEIENPRLGRGTLPEWASEDDAWEADYMNLRDDRVEVFGTLPQGATREVVYAVRAVTSGTFRLPPVEVEAMYDPDVWARAAGGEVVIAGPWEDYLL